VELACVVFFVVELDARCVGVGVGVGIGIKIK